MTRLLGGLLVVSLIINVVLSLRSRAQVLERAEALANREHVRMQWQSGRLGAIAEQLERQGNLQAKAREELAAIQTVASQRAQHYERLEHENAILREWGAVPLPADVVRLRERPAFTSAADYRQWLSAADTVPAAGEPSDAEQRPAATD